MSNGYIESSLKRFLKRKVKVTLGLIVAFMITGTVGFAAGKEDTGAAEKDKYTAQNSKIEEIEKNFKGIGSSSFTADECKEYTVKLEGNESTTKTVTLSYDDTAKTNTIKVDSININIQDNELTENVKTNIINSLSKTYSGPVVTDKDNEGLVIGALNSTSQKLTNGGIIINNGVIIGAQDATSGGTIENNGLIYVTRGGNNYFGGQKIGDSSDPNITQDVNLINNGLIISKDLAVGQYAYYGGDYKANLINNGIIKSESFGQYFRKGEGELYNYGVIETKSTGQQSNISTTTSYNYGTIDVSEEATGSKTGKGQETGTLYNYGLIKVTDGLAMNGTNYNYGVIKSGNGNVFNGTTNNNGIVISKKADTLSTSKWAENSALFKWAGTNEKPSYSLVNGTEFSDNSKITNESFGENKIGAIVNGKADITGTIAYKNIASIVTDDNIGTVFTTTGDEFILDNTNITGYFENTTGGVLLDATNSDLTLAGNTNITAVKDQQKTTGNVTAVKLGADKTLTILGDVSINGKIEGIENSTVKAYVFKKEVEIDKADLTLANIENPEGYAEEVNYTDTKIKEGSEIDNLVLDFTNTTEGKVNKVFVGGNTTVNSFEDLTSSDVKLEMELKDIENFAAALDDGIKLGAGENTLTVNNTISDFKKEINLGTGDKDTLVINENSREINEFRYNVKNAETVALSGGTWKIGEGNISFDNAQTAHINMTGDSVLNITLNQTGSDLSDLLNADKVTNGEHLVFSTDEGSKIRYYISEEGIKAETLSTDTYSIDKNAEVVAPIFNVSQTGNAGDNGVEMSVKTAEQAGVGEFKPVYDAFIDAISGDNINTDVIDKINGMNSNDDIKKLIKNTNVAAEAYYTAGTVVTKNITDSYLSAVEEFGKRAQKGEWIAQGKFINSDTEFDGGSEVKGYEGDINSAVGMVEYGVSDATSYGVAFGGGDTEVDINGGGKLDGNNYYVGAYMKHKTANGVDVVGNIGFIKSDLDSKLSNDFKLTDGGKIDISGSSLVDGTADSTAVAMSLRGKKDFHITDTVKLQPSLGARFTLINQDKASNPEMGFEVKAQDIFVLEGIAGLDVAKEFALDNGIFELKAGVEYLVAGSSQDHDAEYTLYGSKIELEDSEIASSRGNAHIGADYEHENGVGFNAKYEMMWSDEGDDSRITAGISYRF